jgi:hypothetical protein
LKKRSKKLLSVSRAAGGSPGAPGLPAIGKSFLVLFFKKEHLPSLSS